MSTSLGSDDVENENPPAIYSRKDKSLGVLCSNFMKLYNRDGVESIGLDDAANQLGVERRRIYDIVNIMESIGVLTKKAKNQYSWKGLGAIPRALQELQEHGPHSRKIYYTPEEQLVSSKVENRKEKSLGLLAQNFVKLFLCSNAEMISLDSAAATLLGDLHDPTAMRTKVRRLYDIANVFASLNLLEKMRHPESGKPAFKWLGVKENGKNAHESAFDSSNSKRRAFGTDITNNCSKRFRADSVFNKRSNGKVNEPPQTKHDNLKIKYIENSRKQHPELTSKGFVFGPFTPASVTDTKVPMSKNVRGVQDWEHLASTYRPQYRNQALSNLFTHYANAWKSWLVEVGDKKQL